MKFHKFISIILHPIVVPTIGLLLYFMLIPNRVNSYQKLAILGLVFIITYFIPLLVLLIFKTFGYIKSYQLTSIKERKIPIALMIFLFYLLGSVFSKMSFARELGILFYATSLSLIVVYLLFFFKLKTSLHLLSMGIFVGFFLLLSAMYSVNFTPIIVISILISGLVASSRLYLKAHKTTEVYLGFFLGIIFPFVVNYIL